MENEILKRLKDLEEKYNIMSINFVNLKILTSQNQQGFTSHPYIAYKFTCTKCGGSFYEKNDNAKVCPYCIKKE